MANRDQIVGKPGDEKVPIIIKTEKAETNPQQIATLQNGSNLFDRRGPRASHRFRADGASQTPWGCQQPRNQPEEAGKSHNQKCPAPAIMVETPRNDQAFQNQARAGAEVKDARRQAAF